jgi:hypothetical protein
LLAQDEEEKSQVAKSESLRIGSEIKDKGPSKPQAATKSQGEEEIKAEALT